jgi:DNA-binding LacI/PurR family transcriptional regulator
VLEDPNALGLHEYLHMEFLNGAAAAAHDAGKNLLVTLTRPDETMTVAIRLAREGRVDGLALSLGDATTVASEMRELAEGGLPIVLLQQSSGVAGVETITAQDEVGAAMAMTYLARHGHRHVAWLCGEELWPGPARRFGGVARELGDDPARPTAIVAANDMIALGVVQQALDQGLRVPEDISVVGFNDFDFSSWVRPSLTTVRIPAAAMGRRAVEVLIEAEAGTIPDVPVFPAELVVRDSSGPAPA